MDQHNLVFTSIFVFLSLTQIWGLIHLFFYVDFIVHVVLTSRLPFPCIMIMARTLIIAIWIPFSPIFLQFRHPFRDLRPPLKTAPFFCVVSPCASGTATSGCEFVTPSPLGGGGSSAQSHFYLVWFVLFWLML